MDNVAPTTKVCNTCFEEMTLDNFHRGKHHRDRRSPRCKHCANQFKREWRGRIDPAKKKAERRRRYELHEQGQARRPESSRYMRNWKLRRLYGISIDQFNAMLAAQEHKCALCHEEFIYGGNRKPALDHDHKTGEIRGIVCKRCNQGLGQLGDDEAGLLRALEYLRRPRPTIPRVEKNQ